MTHIYYRTQTYNTNEPTKSDREAAKESWTRLSNKSYWRITQLATGYHQAEWLNPEEEWVAQTRRQTADECEAAIDGSIVHYQQRLRGLEGPKVVRTFSKD